MRNLLRIKLVCLFLIKSLCLAINEALAKGEIKMHLST